MELIFKIRQVEIKGLVLSEIFVSKSVVVQTVKQQKTNLDFT